MRLVLHNKSLSILWVLLLGLYLSISTLVANAQQPTPDLLQLGYCAIPGKTSCVNTTFGACGGSRGSFFPDSATAEKDCAVKLSPPAGSPPSTPTKPLPTEASLVDTSTQKSVQKALESSGSQPRRDFVPLTNLPGLSEDYQKRTLVDYLNVLFRLSIGLGAMIAVIRIIWAGIKYMSHDLYSSKEEAKKDIASALQGLLIMLSTVVVLQFIYPDILNLNVLGNLRGLEVRNVPPSSDTAQTVPERGPCGSVSKCANAGQCYKDESRCVPAYGGETGICLASCAKPALGGSGATCQGTAECQTGLVCKVTSPSCQSATANTGPGQCLTVNCKLK